MPVEKRVPVVCSPPGVASLALEHPDGSALADPILRDPGVPDGFAPEGVADMEGAVRGLDDGGVAVLAHLLLVVGLLAVASRLQVAQVWPGGALVRAQGDGQGVAGVRALVVVEHHHDGSALQHGSLDAGVVVGQPGGNRAAPGAAVVLGVRGVDVVRVAAPEPRPQRARAQPHHRRLHAAAQAAVHHVLRPRPAPVAAALHGGVLRVVAQEAGRRVVHRQQPLLAVPGPQ
mmetsp:Transcript_15764/g.40043  ORF Transcript_15764/g.40043 Transcript_15764/m.40043 type:complete len:231 (+) Transcript_15764:1005-1697(+)